MKSHYYSWFFYFGQMNRRVARCGVLLVCVFSIMTSTVFAAKLNAWNIPVEAEKEKNPRPQDPETIKHGCAVYRRCCMNCHGLRGLASKSVWDSGEGGLFYKISNGKRSMPGFKDRLSKDEIWQVISYLKTLQPAGRP